MTGLVIGCNPFQNTWRKNPEKGSSHMTSQLSGAAPPSPFAMLSVQDVIYDYPGGRALHGVSVTITPGSVTALVGPNGAGKTTLLKCLAALEHPFSGRVVIDGIDTQIDPRAVHERVGYLPDFFGLYDGLTVRQSLVYAARARGFSAKDAEQAAAFAAERVGLTERIKQTAGTLSRGLRQRLAIGQAIVHRPKVLLLDEPAAGLDPDARRHLSDLVRALADEGVTLVVSSHILAELEDYCDQMVMIRDGRVAGGGVIAADAHCAVEVRLVTVDVRLSEVLSGIGNVRIAGVDGPVARIVIEGGPDAEAQVLASLVSQGLAVRSFAVQTARLEAAYMAEMRAGSAGSMGAVKTGGRS
jgi:ABC-2 type transport system ATP-binding protein